MPNTSHLLLINTFTFVRPCKLELSRNYGNIYMYDTTSDVCHWNIFKEMNFNKAICHIYNAQTLLDSIALSPFKSFFEKFNIDTPEVLNKTKSLSRLKGLTYLNRLSLYLSRAGKKLKFSKLILWSLVNIIEILKRQGPSLDITSSLKTLYLFQTLSSLPNFSFQKVNFLKYKELTNYSFLKNSNITKLDTLTLNNLLFENFKKFNYLFSFYIYKVDKKIYKNSRGKSGKYTFIWKYVAPYKRYFLIMHWLAKEIRISAGKTLYNRVYTVLQNFVLNTTATWIWKIKKFSLNYVYYNLQKTLGSTYRTSTR